MNIRHIFATLTGLMRSKGTLDAECERIKKEIYGQASKLPAEKETELWRQADKFSKLSRTIYAKAEKYLLSLGAELIGSGCYSQAYQLVMPWGPVVVKLSYDDGVNYPTRGELAQNSALRKYFLRPLFASRYVMVQPLCVIPESQKRREISRLLEDEISRACPSGRTHDAHAGNVGLYRGQPRIFDALSYVRNF